MLSRLLLIVLICVLLLPLLYMGSYLALLRVRFSSFSMSMGRVHPRRSFAEYRYGGARAKLIFQPLEDVDRKLRPSAWQSDNPFDD